MKRQSPKWKNEIERDQKKNHEPEEMGAAIGIVFGAIMGVVNDKLIGVSMLLGVAIGGFLGMLFRWFADRKD